MTLAAIKRRANKARQFPANTCPASRHLHMIADDLARGNVEWITSEPEHVAESIYAVLASLWEARTKMEEK